jgi:uncharacterized protein (DUF3084 family)
MAETIVQFILGVVEAVFDVLLVRTGRTALSLFGRKSNTIVETLVGILILAAVGMLLLVAFG